MVQAEEQTGFHLHGSLPLFRRRVGEAIEILVLGTAAGGGFPQWNCRCPNCLLAREPVGGLRPRFQSSVAVNVGGNEWLLVNASPDLPRQLESYFNPRQGSIRSTPFAEILLTNADLDHSLGLLLLREGSRLQVTAPSGVCDTLSHFLHFDAVLNSACGVHWREPREEWQPSALPGLQYRAVPIPHAVAPRFAPPSHGNHGVGYLVRHGDAGRVAGFFPDVGEWNDSLLKILGECHTVFFDGTFWTDDELIQLGISDRSARQMGHIPVRDSSKRLALLRANGTEIFFLHLNNTNPVLNPEAKERLEIEAAGLRVAEDGMRLVL